jgi:hypothetical protein
MGGVPQSGGQTMSALGGVSHVDNAADPAITSTATTARTTSNRTGDVARTGGAAYDSAGTA